MAPFGHLSALTRGAVGCLAQPGLLWSKPESEKLQIPNICAIVHE